MSKQKLAECLANVKAGGALVHNITNYVTVNDVANVILASGASPIMSDEPKDVEDITSICGGLNINIGTLNERTIEAMYLSGAKANELGHKVLLDPVGAGASALRTDTANGLLKKVKFDVVRGNVSEIKTLVAGVGTTKGVDADAADAVTEENLGEMVAFTKAFAGELDCVVAITGAIDLVADKDSCYVIRNGVPENRLPAVRHDDRLPGGKPGLPAGSGGRRGLHYGPCRGSRPVPPAAGRRELDTAEPHHRCHQQHDTGTACRRREVRGEVT